MRDAEAKQTEAERSTTFDGPGSHVAFLACVEEVAKERDMEEALHAWVKKTWKAATA